MEDDGVLRELVEVRYRLYEDGRRSGYAGNFSGANRLEDREERIRILANVEQLRDVSL